MAEPDDMNAMSDAQVPVAASEHLDHDQDPLMVEPHGANDMADAQVPLSPVDNMDHDQDTPVPSIEQVRDPDSLFIPEDEPPSQIITHQQEPIAPIAPIATPPTLTPPRPKPIGHQSIIQKIRAMQKDRQHQKLVASRQTTAYPTNSNLDDEAYLEAVRPGQSSSAAVPAINEDNLADKKAARDFLAKKRYFDEQRRKKGTLSFLEDVEWMRIRGEEEARKKKRSRDLAKDREANDGQCDLFPEFILTSNIAEEVESDQNFDVEDSGSRKRRRPMPTKEGQPMSMQAAELQSMRVALEAEDDASRKKKKGAVASAEEQASVPSGRGKGSKGKGPAKPRSGPKKPTRTRGDRTSKNKQNTIHAVKQAASFFNADVFQQQAGANAADQPGFRSRNKADALRELIASVPLDDRKKATTDMNVLLKATKDFDGTGVVKADGHGHWRVRGMSTSLKAYQVLGTAFMRRRENGSDEPKGGLMADQMGLGKTLMMLANIINGQPPKNDTGPKTTLLIATPALLTQWKNEIELHTDASKVNLRIMRYGAGTRLDSTNADQILAGHDVVLTTYTEIMKSYPKNEPPIECQTAEQKLAWWRGVFETQRGPLHRMMFLRIVLDEAQAIKNHMSRTSIACRALMAHHKWALSGTPILNSLSELYPYFKFLGVPHTGSFKIFKHNYCDSQNEENTERLLVRLSQFMIRRTHADEMFGAPILKLPQADQSTYWCDFNSVERSIYDIVRSRFAKCINMWAQNGTLDKSYGNALVMLLRLRQLTGHILMLQFVIRDLLEREDIEAIKSVVDNEAKNKNNQNGKTIMSVRKQLDKVAADQKKKTAAIAAKKDATKKAAKARKDAAKKAAKERGEAYVSEDETANANAIDKDDDLLEEEFDEVVEEDPADDLIQKFTTGGEFGKDFNFKPFLGSLKTGESWEKTKQKAKCGWCGKQPRAPHITSCGHLICKEPCYENEVILPMAEEDTEIIPPCKACGATPTHIHPCEVDEDDTPDAPARGTRANKKKNKEKQRARLGQEDIAENWLTFAGDDVLPSAKTIAVKSQIINWLKENEQVKIIVYTQFLAMIRILAQVFKKEGWQFAEYHGKMSLSARDKAISSFAENPDCQIMLASLRCGGLGLNLTMASKVIMIDPWWNSASEQQAFCRVFRIGQREETFMSRLCVKNTVDEHLIGMQDRKDKEIAAIMEDDGKTMKKMDTRALMRLFGNLEEDPDGRPFIMVDNPDPRGGFRADRDDEGYADDL